MGICSSQMTRKPVNFLPHRPTVMVIHPDGSLSEHTDPTRASHILARHPGSFLCSAESMYVDSVAPPVRHDEQLEPGQIYFLLPNSQAQKAQTLQDLCGLAIKASLALGFDFRPPAAVKRTARCTVAAPYNLNVAKLVSQARTSCRILAGFDGGRRIEL